VVLEAKAAGLPIIGSRLGGIAELAASLRTACWFRQVT
jgi:glycosyltransferase involved in cell wall biosynthesis